MVDYDVIVVGAGHAGCEAALASARLGANTLLLTISPDTIAAMSCNPAIGGPAAKSHLVRELDALGGQMARVIDRTYLNIRRINESRGPAVLALRAQADKRLYQAEMTLTIEREPNLSLKQGMVTEILTDKNLVTGVRLKSGLKYFAKAVILSTGTFLGGEIVMGNIRYQGGRQGEPAANELSENLKKSGLNLRRFQTATPPRILRQSVDFEKINPQPLQDPSWGFSWDGLSIKREQQPCWVTATTQKTIDTILANIDKSPIRSGVIVSKGPHFCPSIDRKVINFPAKNDHLIFLEPEGVYTEELYLLGLTTAMPEEIQEEILATIPGLEKAEIVRPGYAVEYDCLESFEFKPSLESKKINNLYTAGQINGTSGYEEAAVQGVVAGINAVRKIKGLEPYIPDRTTSYIGVLIDDLTTLGTEEPYRMMTSLAEFRLFLRLDNSLMRLFNTGKDLGLINNEREKKFDYLLQAAENLQDFINNKKIPIDSAIWLKYQLAKPERGYRLKELILRPEINDIQLIDEFAQLQQFPPPIREYVWNEIKLAGYLKRQEHQVQEIKKFNQIDLPDNFWVNLKGISNNGLKKLELIKPLTLGQALRIKDLTEADRALLTLKFISKEKVTGYEAVI